ncbi:MAG: hypothetical protein FWG25_02330 [Promicromonosporaceae bacterium]|nr:hypothetical protein [Promicromonosporaceae bacterium]
MRRAALVGIISMLVSIAAAAYLSGVMAFQFLNALPGATPEAVLTGAAEAANTQFLIAAGVMVAFLVATILAARALLLGLNIGNPLRVMRGPLILTIVGAIMNVALSLPLVFLVMLGGLAWGAYRVFDESFNPIPKRARLVGVTKTNRQFGGAGDLSDGII